MNVTSVKRLSLCWTKQSSWFPLSSPWVSFCACSGKLLVTLYINYLLSTVSDLPAISQSAITASALSHVSFFLSGIRLPWTPPRLCFSWWQRRACPACPPAWGRFILATETLTASSTSPTPHRRCLELLDQQPGRPAELKDQMN